MTDRVVVTLLRKLVQINTSNPPGNEAQVAEHLAPRLRALGFEVEIVQTPTAGKAHLIARLRAANPIEKPILLAEADEEGDSYGTGWLADNHWDKIDAGVSLVLAEVGAAQ
jgi:acetylornithine deacetylase/succinyl-diaminopimelate desuccinylase-like protein